MLQIIHTADLHLGAPIDTSDLPHQTQLLVQQNALKTFGWICAKATQLRVHAVVIAGDFFNTLTPDRRIVQHVCCYIDAAAPIQFVIIPGNHDPRDLCTAWSAPEWPANAFIFPDQVIRPHTPPGAPMTFWGHAWSTRENFDSPLKNWSVPVEYATSYNVIVAHGSETRSQPPAWQKYAPFDACSIPAQRLDYIALGHLHHWSRSRSAFHPPFTYPGSPAPTSRTELGPRSVALVTFHGPGIDVERLDTPSIEFHRDVFNLRESATTAPLKQQLVSKYGMPPERSILSLALVGTPPQKVRDQLQGLIDRHRPSFLALHAMDLTTSLDQLNGLLAADPHYKQFIDELDTAIDESEAPELRELYLVARTTALNTLMGASQPPKTL